MKILMLCMEFAPVNTTGHYRAAGFARHLKKFGIEPIVLTCDEQSGIRAFSTSVDQKLMEGLEDIKIYRFPIAPFKRIWKTKIGNFLRIWWNSTDKMAHRWYTKSMQKELDDITDEHKPDLLYVSLPPFSMYYAALKIKKKYKIPLIVDMRDAWSLWGNSPFSTRIHYHVVKYYESKLFRQANAVIGVTPELVNDFRKQHLSIDSEKFNVIYNGFDDNLFSKTKKSTYSKNVFKIGYVGSFYYRPEAEKLSNVKWWNRSLYKKLYFWPRREEWIYRSPYYFLSTMALFNNQNTSFPKIEFHYVGSSPSWLVKMINDFELNDYFVEHGFVPKQEVVKLQNSWDALLATSEKIVNGDHFCLPSKSFDYISTGLPILAFITNGSQKNFYHDYKQCFQFDPDEVLQNVSKLRSVMVKLKSGISVDSISTFYSRKYQSRLLYDLIIDVVI